MFPSSLLRLLFVFGIAYQRCWQSKNGDCFKDNSKFCNACGLATDFYVFHFSDDLISILRLKNTFKIITNNEFKINKNGQISKKTFMRLLDTLKLTKIYFLYVRTQSATCGVGFCPMTLPCISSGIRLAARRHDILNLIFVSFKSIRPVKTWIYKNKSSFDLVIFANFLPRFDRH